MVRGSLNRQLAIVRFLNLVTGGRVGLTAEALSSRGEEAPLPSRSEVIEWARAMLSEDVQVESVLPEMVRAYIERSRSPRGE
jgi:hypothetical protein